MDIDKSLMDSEVPRLDGLAELTPTFSVSVLLCHPDANPKGAFHSLVKFIRTALDWRGRAESVRCLGEVVLAESDRIEGIGSLLELGIDGLYASARERRTMPSWSGEHQQVFDVANQLTVVVRRGPFVVIHTPVSDEALRKWLQRFNKLYRYLPSAILRRTFQGDGKTVWLRGVHRRRATKADSKTLGGLRIQEVLDDEDSSFALSAAAIDYVPMDESAVVRGRLTVTPAKSRLYWKFRLDLPTFLAAATETVALIEKSLAVEPPEEQFWQLAVPETDLANVYGAYDVTIAEPDELPDPADPDGDLTERAELLRNSFLEVHGDPKSPAFTAIVGCEGAGVGSLSIKPVARGDGFELEVRFAGTPSNDAMARRIRDAIGDGELLRIYYESGHTFDEYQVNLQNQTAPPFANLEFADFGAHRVNQEKPPVRGDQAIHDAIGLVNDYSLFAWVKTTYTTGWLVCDDGAGEVADFLHLVDGTLTAIHVKGAQSTSSTRSVAVTAYQEVVAQAVKNLRLLDNPALVERFTTPRIARPAAWLDGTRQTDLSGFVTALGARTTLNKTKVVIVQPHLLRPVHDAARKAAEQGKPTRDSRSLALLDGLLRSARRTVISYWDDLTVIGSE
ncbi:hypothetical protein [Amycolatopsis keratiniphila]|uniref:Uncharacterized protein n=1 Tax=Amycolatopsis keratiniphila TaxID=129921 RepID=R4TDX5_9PSEU|nr:hypothetical protein [Amycolatopsis keratiniphila]AGM08962.1 hypothetical protein AORI_6379 [Amycolatopsis keratiniphila]